VDASGAYTVLGEGDDQKIDFGATCRTQNDAGNEITIFAYSRDVKQGKTLGPTEGYYCGTFETITCKSGKEQTSIDFYGEAKKQYLFIALARGTGDEISLNVVSVPPTKKEVPKPFPSAPKKGSSKKKSAAQEIKTNQGISVNTADIGMIPSFYEDLEKCGTVGIDLSGVDASGAYTVLGEGDDQKIDFGATCRTQNDAGNEITIFAYSRDVKQGKTLGPTEGYYCGTFETITCKSGKEQTSIDFYGEAKKQYLFIALARGTGDEISLNVVAGPPAPAAAAPAAKKEGSFGSFKSMGKIGKGHHG